MVKKARKKLVITGGIFLALVLTLGLSRCSTVSYLSQAAGGQIRIMWNSKPISRIKPGEVDSLAMNKLKMVLQIRAFASDALGLPKNKSYTVYSDIKGPYLGWNVYCAPRFSVEPRLWCFPIAGCVVYRGYFSKEKALKFADEQKRAGWDTYISPFSGYSTLGWFRDPVLSTQLSMDSVDLAGLVIHELAHQELYKPGDSDFSESFAIAVEQSGIVRWFRSLGREDQAVAATRGWEAEHHRAEQILAVRAGLDSLYHSGLDSLTILHRKDSVFNALELLLYHKNRPDIELNNAFIAPVKAYYSKVPQFLNLLDSCGGNFPEFYRKAKELSR